ncbi:rubrerythrin family protein [Candidatus Micrarchaeota archaeon]|nr:rubrerythrin family protein [Candidatus Micrarchaeota archaeon]MBU1929956.1 rubrerythrin family protein [Candidatus Micrarchaeota archaeon]
MEEKFKARLVHAQKNEITEHFVYAHLAPKIKNAHNRMVLERMAKDELRHYQILKSFTKQEVTPVWWKVNWYALLARTVGLAFVLRLMEKGERLTSAVYLRLSTSLPEAKQLMEDEKFHEQKVLDLLKEEKLEYAGSVVLGLNDALVELSGALAGLTLALQNTTSIAVIGLITGVVAALSMASSGYLSSKEDAKLRTGKNPFKSAVYTGIAYIITVLILVTPYFLFSNVFLALGVMLVLSILIILSYTFYISVAKNLSLKQRFLEMAAISLVVALIGFLVGWALSSAFSINA